MRIHPPGVSSRGKEIPSVLPVCSLLLPIEDIEEQAFWALQQVVSVLVSARDEGLGGLGSDEDRGQDEAQSDWGGERDVERGKRTFGYIGSLEDLTWITNLVRRR
jgi:hypothetical protein